MISKKFALGAELNKLFEDTINTQSASRAQKAMKHLDEKDKQDELTKDLEGKEQPVKDDSSDSGEQQEAKPEKQDGEKGVDNRDKAPPKPDTSKEDNEKLEQGDIELKDVIEQINSLRSGKSLKNNGVYANFEKYFNGLDDAEKTALFTFLKSMVEIVVGDAEGDSVTDPSDNPANVKMDKKKPQEKQVYHIKPNVIKKNSADQSTGGSEQSSGLEDTTAPQNMPVNPRKK